MTIQVTIRNDDLTRNVRVRTMNVETDTQYTNNGVVEPFQARLFYVWDGVYIKLEEE